MTANIWPG